MKRILTYKAEEHYIGKTIKTLLKQHFNMSASLISDLKKSEDGICVNGKKEYVSYIIQFDDTVMITMRESASGNIIPVKIPLDIVYEDEDVIIINKQYDLPTHPSQGHYEKTVANALMYYFCEKGEDCVFHAVNRLDKDTSGLMAVAKNKYAHALLCGQIKSGILKRKYTAIVCGNVEKDGAVDAPIAREEGSTIKRTVLPQGQNAVTNYRVLSRFGDYTLLELELETGRTHQIRVHLSHIGYPLLGDWLYGEENKELFPRTALHSSYIRFIQPVTGKLIEFSADLPDDMKKFVEKIR